MELWLAILVAAVFVFIVSSVLHMCVPLHKSDFTQLGAEDKVLAAMREHGVKPGEYMFPYCTDMKEMAGPEMKAKHEQGPVGFLTILPNGPCQIGKPLLQWFVLCIVVSAIVAYVAGISIGPGEDRMLVFRHTATAAILAYAMGSVTNSIWKAVAWSTTAKFLFDGLLYGLATGAAFAWLWPGPA
jgi:hypothetical protein